MDPDLIFRAGGLAVLLTAFLISAIYRNRARKVSGTIKRQEEGRAALAARMILALPLLAVLLLNIFLPAALSWADFDPPFSLRVLGLILAVLCLPLLWWVFRSIGSNISETVLTKAEHELVTSGPYRWIRHPLYAGALLLLLGLSLVFGDWILLGYTVAGALLFRLLVIPEEEKQLLNTFGEDYECYQSRTGALLPWLR